METVEIKIQVQTDTDQLLSVIEKALQIHQEFLKDYKGSQVTIQVQSGNEQIVHCHNTSVPPLSIAERF